MNSPKIVFILESAYIFDCRSTTHFRLACYSLDGWTQVISFDLQFFGHASGRGAGHSFDRRTETEKRGRRHLFRSIYGGKSGDGQRPAAGQLRPP
ncbi:hypothetical protein CEXT_291131 [Caerostris extrusa]|uniref:Uncharacterized protein n=1 Tax=Caerostris extrusa TaxID=172846 RepID=A0AAV4QMP3_CAEEX|nr:hypothetical protein CEXT_291131 [Caerostris extrusa]